MIFKMTEGRKSHRQSSGCYSYEEPVEASTTDTTCLICMDVLMTPCMLDCHHLFCEACLQLYFNIFKNVEDGETSLPCPICRKKIVLPGGTISPLKQASVDSHRGGERKVSAVGDNAIPECDVCAFKMKAIECSYYCNKCSMNFCDACSTVHDQQSVFKNHTSEPISNRETLTLYCEYHKLQIAYFCMDCQSPECAICVIQTHSSHQNVKLYEALAMRRDNLKSHLNTLWPKLNKLDLQVQQLMKLNTASRRKNGMSMPSSPVIAIPRTQPMSTSTHSLSNKSQSSPPILQPLKDDFKCMDSDFSLTKTQHIQFHMENLKKLFDKSIKILEMSQSKKLMAPYKSFVDRLEAVLEFELRQLQNEVDAGLRKEKEMYSQMQGGSPNYPKCSSSSSLYSLQDRPNSVASSLTDTSPTLEDCLFEMPPQSSMLVQPQMQWKVEKQRNDAGELWNPCDVAFLRDGNMVVAEYDVLNDKNNKLRIFDPTGKSTSTIAKGAIRPLGVAITREGNIAVTDCKGKRVKLFSPNGQLISDIGKGQFGWPYGITTNSKGQIIVTDAFNDVINIYQPDGKRIKQFGSSGSNNNQFRNPYHVTNDNKDNIIVSDSGNNCFKLFNSNGDFILRSQDEHRVSTGGEKTRRRGLKGPRGITTDLKSNILVADDRCRVAHYSNTGKYIRNLLTKEDSVKYPEALCCSQDGHLVVTEWNPNNMFAVKVFNLYE